MNREQKILEHARQDSLGLEIGPSYAPVAPKAKGFKVHVLDHTDRAGLIAKYPANDHGRIEEVDYIWAGQSYRELVGAHRYHWLIASHVIEHVPDLIGFINECDSILESDGILSLVIPDQRFCFDRLRARTGVGQIVDAQGRKSHSPGAVFDYYANTVMNGDKRLWSNNEGAQLALMMPPGMDHHAYRLAAKGQAYDIHAWVFTPTSFRLILQDLADLELIKLREVAHHPTQDGEFFVTLARNGREQMDRITALKQIELESSHLAAPGL